MSQKLTQPEEIGHILNEMAGNGLKVDEPVKGDKGGVAPAGWSGSYVPPYRAAYLKSHGLSVRSDPSRQSGKVLE